MPPFIGQKHGIKTIANIRLERELKIFINYSKYLKDIICYVFSKNDFIGN